MNPQTFRFGGGSAETVLGPAVLVGMIVAIILILLLPKKYIVVPWMVGVFLSPAGQTVLIAGLHVFVPRILILVGWLRLMPSSSSRARLFRKLTVLDKAFVLWALFRATSFVLLFLQGGAIVNQLGFIWDVLGSYFLLRALIRDEEDILCVIRAFVGIAVILAGTMWYERSHDLNLYGVIGSVPIIPEIRNGSVRAQGPFEHALLAGTFGATLLPLFFWLFRSGKSRLLGILGTIAAAIIPFTTECSTPIMALGAGIFALLFWPLRKQMRLVRRGIVCALIGLQLVMKVPFWWAIQHIDIIGGSSGWHRAELVDVFIRHFFSWWLIGTKDNASWGHQTWDICNQYVAEGESGGLVTLICFIALIYICFKWLGISRKAVEGDRKKEWFFWMLAASLFAHVIAYLGISYFDQTRISWIALLVMISAAATPYLSTETTASDVSYNGGGALAVGSPMALNARPGSQRIAVQHGSNQTGQPQKFHLKWLREPK